MINKIVADAVAETEAKTAKALFAATAKVAAAKAEATKAKAAKTEAARADAAKRKSIACSVKSFRDLGASDQEIKRLLTGNYGLSPDDAEKYL